MRINKEDRSKIHYDGDAPMKNWRCLSIKEKQTSKTVCIFIRGKNVARQLSAPQPKKNELTRPLQEPLEVCTFIRITLYQSLLTSLF